MHNFSFRNRLVILLGLALIPALCLPAAGQKKRKGKVPKATTEKDDAYTRIELETGGVGFLYIPKGLPKNEEEHEDGAARPGLLVMLHGHGGTPKNMIRRPIADAHQDYMLSVQGARPMASEGRNGFAWEAGPGKVTITDLVRYVLAHHPVDPSKVVLIGHSAGGTMVLDAYPAAPKLYAGMITIGAPQAPTSAHKKGRVCVILGTADPNYSLAPAVRNAIGGKRKWKSGCLLVLEGAEHNNLPKMPHLLLAVDWCLAGKAEGAEANVPYQVGAAPKRAYRLALIGYKGAEGYDDSRDTNRKKSKAKKLAGSIAKKCAKGKAYFPFEALAHSDHEKSFAFGGLVTLNDLEVLDPALSEAAKSLEAGKVSSVIETKNGYCVLWKNPEK